MQSRESLPTGLHSLIAILITAGGEAATLATSALELLSGVPVSVGVRRVRGLGTGRRVVPCTQYDVGSAA